MATVYKTLGQLAGVTDINTPQTLYQVASGKSALISNIVVCNQSASDQTFRISCSSTTTPEAKEFIAYGVTVPANDSIPLVMGVTLYNSGAGSNVQYLLCSATSASVSFSAFGVEMT